MEQSKIFENYFSNIKSNDIQKQAAMNDHYFQNVKDLTFNKNQYNKIQARVIINNAIYNNWNPVVGMVIHYKQEKPCITIYNGLISLPYNYNTTIIINKIANPAIDNVPMYNILCNISDNNIKQLESKLKHLHDIYIQDINKVLIEILGNSFSDKYIKTKYVTEAINKLLFDPVSAYYKSTHNLLSIYNAISNSILNDNNFINTYEKIKYLYNFIDRNHL